jgi:putative spermidine/putrescine transport system ATP-binding protein
MPKLSLINVSKHYGEIAALDNVTLQVEDREYVCILGPSGCGKSTLIKCVAGIIQQDQGQILIDDKPVHGVSIEDRKIGYVFQDIALFPHMSVKDNISYGLAVRRAPEARIATVANEMLDVINMRDRSKSFPRELSGGAQQKVAVGRAIATGSHLFLLDEPLGALDALVRAELRYDLKHLASDLGLTVIHVTHDQEEALSIADRVVVMKLGRIVEVGKPSEIYLSPRSLFTENFVGETNLLEGKVVDITGSSCIVELGSHKVRVGDANRRVGQRVVVSVRPEFITLTPRRPESGTEWEGQIKQATFLGSINRWVVAVEGEPDLTIHVPSRSETGEFRVGDKVNVSLGQGEHILLFDYPEDGLEKEIALE